MPRRRRTPLRWTSEFNGEDLAAGAAARAPAPMFGRAGERPGPEPAPPQPRPAALHPQSRAEVEAALRRAEVRRETLSLSVRLPGGAGLVLTGTVRGTAGKSIEVVTGERVRVVPVGLVERAVAVPARMAGREPSRVRDPGEAEVVREEDALPEEP